MLKSKCSETVRGRISKIRKARVLCPGFVTVNYEVNDNQFQITERVRTIVKRVRVGGYGVGYRRLPVIKNFVVGAVVTLKVNPNKPKRAYIFDNRVW